ncbi:hypothetical protein O181_038264 [Austropuccinia psidii MF-1]|uniref:Uncharacterized protein n=1 Tax=Austropuccinia psidii MF-1 TaxID=1389203 RepID=A0A9Q3HDE2_9BASI|nr:hypothetical protein [Austropuccinia psidii MF-1]
MKSKSRLFSCLLGGYSGISQAPQSGSGEAEDEELEESFEEEESDEKEVEGVPAAPEAPNLAHSNQPLVSQCEPNFLKMMEQMTQFMRPITQAFSARDNSRAPEFENPFMKAADSFNGTQAHKLKVFI